MNLVKTLEINFVFFFLLLSFELLDKNSIAKGGYIGKNKNKYYLSLVCFSEEESADKANHAGARQDTGVRDCGTERLWY